MPRRKAKAKVDLMEAGEQHGRCRWEGLREQDRLLVNQPAEFTIKPSSATATLN
jgi:hypothetical protein